VLSGDYNVGPCPTAKHHGLKISPLHSEPAEMELGTESIITPSLTNKVIQFFCIIIISTTFRFALEMGDVDETINQSKNPKTNNDFLLKIIFL
jgi:hypothetical protein